MDLIRNYAFALVTFSCSLTVSSQSADEIISKYIKAIGGAEIVKGITSITLETTSKVMGIEITSYITILNGKGFKTETKVFGRCQVACYNYSSGWISSRNGKKIEDMPKDQYELGRNQIFIGWPFLDYSSNGYKVEFSGKDKIGDINANKISITSPENSNSEYWFDPSSGYLIKSFQRAEIEGKEVEVELIYSDYQRTKCGYIMPMETESKMGGRFIISTAVTRVTINQPVSYSDFRKPN